MFSQTYSDGQNFYSRDTFCRFSALVSVVDSPSLKILLEENKFDYVLFNRHEYAFLGGLILSENCKKVLVAHDSAYLRRNNFKNILSVNQPMINFEKALENEIVLQQKIIITISPMEMEYFSKISENTEIFTFGPPIKLPKKIKILKRDKKINFYFLGVNNAINLKTIKKAFNELDKIKQAGFNFSFNIIGSISYHPDIVAISKSNQYILHGVLENLDPCLEKMDVQIAPIVLGSGAALKIAEALSHGHFVITTELAAGPYKEFIGDRIITYSDILLSISKIFEISSKKNNLNSYYRYYNRNSLESKF